MSTKYTITLRDSIEFKLPEEALSTIKDNFVTNGQPGQVLLVKVAATHAGLITRNNGFYLPDKMQAGVASWTANYPKPVQAHHNDDGDPIGRVIRAKYVDISDQTRDKWVGTPIKNSAGKSTKQVDQVFYDNFISGKLSYLRSVDFILDSLLRDGKLDDPNYQGLGYIELVLHIADKVAQEKILDGRYLTGSVSASTDRAICSVCKEDWASGQKCDHKPGKIYDGTKAFLIAGELNYNEYSFVNTPADRHSRVIEIGTGNSVLDSVTIEENEFTCTIPDRPIEVLIEDSASMATDSISIKTLADKQLVISAHDGLHYMYDYGIRETKGGYVISKDNVDLHTKLHKEAKDGGFLGSLKPGPLDNSLEDKSLWPPTVTIQGSQEDSISTMKEKGKESVKTEETKASEGTTEVKDTTAKPEVLIDIENLDELVAKQIAQDKVVLKTFLDSLATVDATAAQEAFDKQLAETSFILSDSSKASIKKQVLEDKTLNTLEGLFDALSNAEWSEYSEETDPNLTNVDLGDLKDAKLSTTQRKKLPGSTFCGPGRSFPVNDCAHVTAARRLIGRAKLSAPSKARVLACVSRKARALGCGTSKKDSLEPVANIGTTTATLTFPEAAKWLQGQELKDEALACLNGALKDKGYEIVALETLVSLNKQVEDLETKVADKACPECKDNLDRVDDLTGQLAALRAELKAIYQDVEVMQARYVESNDQVRQLKADRVAYLEALGGKVFKDYVALEGRVKDLMTEKEEALDALLGNHAKSVDILKIASTINSGLAREPSGQVLEDPVPKQATPSKSATSELISDSAGKGAPVDKRTLSRVSEEYMRILFGGRSQFGSGPTGAQRYLDNLKASRVIPEELTPASLEKVN